MIREIPFHKASIEPSDEDAVLRVLRSGWLTSGSEMKAFEAEFSASLGAPDVQSIAVSSATAGLHLALLALGVGPGDEVLVPDLTFTATAAVVEHCGAEPVLVDVNRDTYLMDYEHAEQCITPNTRAMIPVHFGGLALNPKKLSQFSQKHTLNVVEDAAHAMSAYTLRDGVVSPVGTNESDMTVFSFYATKCITSVEGGMVTTRDPDFADRMRRMRSHGINRDVFSRYTDKTSSWEYDVVQAGFKYNLPDLLAALGRSQLERHLSMRLKRYAVAEAYDQFINHPALIRESSRFGSTAPNFSHHLYVVEVHGGKRDQFIQHMRDQGVHCSVHFKPLSKMSYWHRLPSANTDHQWTSHRIGDMIVSLPIWPDMMWEDIEYVVKAVNSWNG